MSAAIKDIGCGVETVVFEEKEIDLPKLDELIHACTTGRVASRYGFYRFEDQNHARCACR